MNGFNRPDIQGSLGLMFGMAKKTIYATQGRGHDPPLAFWKTSHL